MKCDNFGLSMKSLQYPQRQTGKRTYKIYDRRKGGSNRRAKTRRRIGLSEYESDTAGPLLHFEVENFHRPARVFRPSPFRDGASMSFAVSRRRSPMLRSAPFESRNSTDCEAVCTAIYTSRACALRFLGRGQHRGYVLAKSNAKVRTLRVSELGCYFPALRYATPSN